MTRDPADIAKIAELEALLRQQHGELELALGVSGTSDGTREAWLVLIRAVVTQGRKLDEFEARFQRRSL